MVSCGIRTFFSSELYSLLVNDLKKKISQKGDRGHTRASLKLHLCNGLGNALMFQEKVKANNSIALTMKD